MALYWAFLDFCPRFVLTRTHQQNRVQLWTGGLKNACKNGNQGEVRVSGSQVFIVKYLYMQISYIPHLTQEIYGHIFPLVELTEY